MVSNSQEPLESTQNASFIPTNHENTHEGLGGLDLNEHLEVGSTTTSTSPSLERAWLKITLDDLMRTNEDASLQFNTLNKEIDL